MKKKQSPALLVGVIGLVALVAIWVTYKYLIPPIIEAAYFERSSDFFNNLLSGRKNYTLDYYLHRGDKYFNQLFLLAILVYLIVLGSLLPSRLPQRFWKWLMDFFNSESYPISLAIFRIGFYALMLVFAIDWATGPMDAANVLWWSQFPKALQFPPPGLGWLLEFLPINTTWASITSIIYLVACFTALIGLYTRTSSLIVCFLGFYVLGIPQFYGTINHYQHLLWFALILGLSPSGDMLSVDSIFASWRQADKGNTAPPGADVRYGLPIRITWVLIGVVYFFPGYWKLWESGLTWAFSDNLKMQMYKKWFEIGNFEPLIHIENYPFMYQSAALITLIFEITFVFFVFFRYTRWFSVITGQMFHTMTLILMRIPFIDLQVCYVVFFEWHGILRRLGKWLFKEEMFVLYDGNCKLCRRTIASVRRFDGLGRITYVNALDAQARQAHGLNWLDEAALVVDMHAVTGKEVQTGFAAYQAIARRIPLFWPIYPFLLLLPVVQLGTRLYRRVADSRMCNMLVQRGGQGETAVAQPSRTNLRALRYAGAVLIVVNVILGFAHIHSWPFSMYPTFQTIQGPEFSNVEIEVVTADQEVIPVSHEMVLENFTDDRFFSMVSVIFREAEASGNMARQDRRLLALWHVLEQSNPKIAALNAESINFYKNTYTVIPEELYRNPIESEFITQTHVHDIETLVNTAQDN